jgi:serine protease Do
MSPFQGYEGAAARLIRSTVQVRSGGMGGGSGVVWDSSGRIVTNAHVLNAGSAGIADHTGRQFRARTVRYDRERDLALLQGPAGVCEPAEIGDSEALRPGNIVLAVGSPYGLRGAVTAGIVHAKGPADYAPEGDWIQADVRLAPGNSGGPLGDAAGRVVGITSMIYRGLGLAISSAEVEAFVRGDEPLRLGVELMPVERGLLVVGIERSSLAERYGVMTGDIVVSTIPDFKRLLRAARRSGQADIPMLRGGMSWTLHLEVPRSSGAQAA